MTRSVTIVNTSNWEHEDISVKVEGASPVRLQPGEKLICGPYSVGEAGDVQVHMIALEDAEPIPFKNEDGSQDLPSVEIHKPKGSAET